MMPLVGVWPSKRRLVAVGLGFFLAPERPLSVPLTPAGYSQLLEALLVEGRVDLVVPESLLQVEGLGVAEAALARGFTVWVVTDELVDAIDLATGHTRSSPSRRAAILARLPTIPSYRNFLHVARSRLGQQQLFR